MHQNQSLPQIYVDFHADICHTTIIIIKLSSIYGFRGGNMKKLLHYFSKWEWTLWGGSCLLIILSFLLFERGDYLSLAASLVGCTALIFSAKGNPLGPFFMIIFSILYGIISYSFAYYGEMITYLGMSLPLSVFALIVWMKNPYKDKKSEVAVGHVRAREFPFMILAALAVTVIFYFILKYLGTANLLPSTLSVATSFLAAYLTFRRSAFFALAYAANDVVLIVLWILASITDISYLSVVICFVVFLVNDSYSFFNWLRMQKRQANV